MRELLSHAAARPGPEARAKGRPGRLGEPRLLVRPPLVWTKTRSRCGELCACNISKNIQIYQNIHKYNKYIQMYTIYQNIWKYIPITQIYTAITIINCYEKCWALMKEEKDGEAFGAHFRSTTIPEPFWKSADLSKRRACELAVSIPVLVISWDN